MTTERKLIIAGVIAFFALAIGEIWYRGTATSIGDSPSHNQLIGKRYKTKITLYLSQDRQSAWYFIKSPGYFSPELADIKEYPHGTSHQIIHKLLPEGTGFSITDVIITKTPFRGEDKWVMGRFDDVRIFSGQFCVNYISDYNSNNEKMKSKYVTEITPEGEPVNDK